MLGTGVGAGTGVAVARRRAVRFRVLRTSVRPGAGRRARTVPAFRRCSAAGADGRARRRGRRTGRKARAFLAGVFLAGAFATCLLRRVTRASPAATLRSGSPVRFCARRACFQALRAAPACLRARRASRLASFRRLRARLSSSLAIRTRCLATSASRRARSRGAMGTSGSLLVFFMCRPASERASVSHKPSPVASKPPRLPGSCA
jgi:hypothetical protein